MKYRPFSAFAVCLVSIFAILPTIFGILAVFTDGTRLSAGIDIFQSGARSFSAAIEKFIYLSENPELIYAIPRTLAIALIVGFVTSGSAMVLSYCLTRIRVGALSVIRITPYFAYLTPPVILVVSLTWITESDLHAAAPLLTVMVGLCAFLFPLNYGLALGHWLQTGRQLDRTAALDGANFWDRFFLHLRRGTPSFAFFNSLALLSFMLAWSDVVFSRVLLMNDRDNRLLTDLVIDLLSQSDVLEPRGELAALAVITTTLALLASLFYNHAFSRSLAKS